MASRGVPRWTDDQAGAGSVAEDTAVEMILTSVPMVPTTGLVPQRCAGRPRPLDHGNVNEPEEQVPTALAASRLRTVGATQTPPAAMATAVFFRKARLVFV